jgi:hypothetical protein
MRKHRPIPTARKNIDGSIAFTCSVCRKPVERSTKVGPSARGRLMVVKPTFVHSEAVR